MIWTSPDGRTYVTTPGSRLLFPSLCAPTAPVTDTMPVPPAAYGAGLTMPRRRMTRAEDRRRHVADEREANRAAIEDDHLAALDDIVAADIGPPDCIPPF